MDGTGQGPREGQEPASSQKTSPGREGCVSEPFVRIRNYRRACFDIF